MLYQLIPKHSIAFKIHWCMRDIIIIIIIIIIIVIIIIIYL